MRGAESSQPEVMMMAVCRGTSGEVVVKYRSSRGCGTHCFLVDGGRGSLGDGVLPSFLRVDVFNYSTREISPTRS